MTLNRVKLGRTVTFMKYLVNTVTLMFLPKTLIWNKITFRLSNSLNLAGLVVNELRRESHIDFRKQCVIMTHDPPTSYYMRQFRIFNKIDSSLKNVPNVLHSKKGRLHLWRTPCFTYNCWFAFFLFLCGFQEKIETSWRNYLIWTTNWGREHNTQDTQTAIIIFLSEVAVMRVIVWTEDNFCFISDCRNSFNCSLKKLIKSK